MKRTALAALVVLTALVAGCGPGATPKPNVVEKSIETTEFAFAPKEIDIPAGSALKVTLVNKGVLEHDFAIDSLGFKVSVPIGGTQSGTTGALAAGKYDFYCSIAGHKEAGMVGTLTVK